MCDWLSVGGFDHGGPDQPVLHGVALLQDLGDDGIALAFAVLMHDGVVEIGVKGLAFRAAGGDTGLGEDIPELLEDHFDPLAGFLRLGGPLQIVQHREDGRHSVHLSVQIGAVLFLLGPLAEVVVLCQETLVALVLLGALVFQLFDLFLQSFQPALFASGFLVLLGLGGLGGGLR